MRRRHVAWAATVLVMACSGKDHSLGVGRVKVEPGTGGTSDSGATGAASGGAGAPGQEMMPGMGGAPPSMNLPSNPPDSGARAAGGAPGSTGGAGPAAGGAAPNTGASTGSGGVRVAIAPPGAADPVIPAVSGGCPAFTNATITFMGLDGIQIAAGPKPMAPSAPMLVYWHGTGSTSGEYALMAKPIADGVILGGGVIVSFQGTTGGDLLSGTNIFGKGDLTIVDQLVACAVRDHNVDPRKIYTMGCSAGGLFADAMAALRSNYVAAASSNSGGWVTAVPFENDYTPPLMTVHGSGGEDVLVIDFVSSSATADMAFKARGGFAIDCNTQGGHCGGANLAGDVWKFFLAHTYGVSPEPWTQGLPADFSTQCLIE